jgi:SAM-dependent methyltransferase
MDGPARETMAAIGDELAGAAIAAQVRAFYEQLPYPEPVADLKGYGGAWDETRRRAEFHLFWPEEQYRDDRNILIAGCGTSQAAKYAMRWPKARVTGIDFSKASIEETAKLKRKHSLHNLDLVQLPIERASELGRDFDFIVCTGALHHLADPDAGLRALRAVLSPDGAMHLMVYAPYGRTGIYMMQEYCRRLGIGTTQAEIQQLATSLVMLPPDHPLMPLLRKVPDLRNAAGLADALLNPRDRAFSVPQLFDLLAATGLAFGRWLRQAPYLPSCGALSQSPHAERIEQLLQAEQFAAVELFRGTMVVHSVVAYRVDHPKRRAVTFDGDDWLSYVPIPVPDTVVVEERLPPTAAAVLINRNHTYTDVYLPIDARQKALFESIDGVSSIGELADKTRLGPIARTLFERLWQYDHVVFDSSRRTN